MVNKKPVNKKKNNVTKRSNKAASLFLHTKGEIFKMATKLGTQKIVEVEGIEYTLQHPGHREATRIQDRVQLGEGKVSTEKYYEELMKHVIVSPKTSWDYFDGNEKKEIEGVDGFEDVMKEAADFLRE
jgi:hypothetical protein